VNPFEFAKPFVPKKVASQKVVLANRKNRVTLICSIPELANIINSHSPVFDSKQRQPYINA